MIGTYFENSNLSMTKDVYFEMCDALGSEPLEEEIPIDLEDFPHEVRVAFNIYYMLTDIWDAMGGNYMGKDTSVLFNFFDLYDIDRPDRLFIVELLQHMDRARAKVISAKIAAQKQPPSK